MISAMSWIHKGEGKLWSHKIATKMTTAMDIQFDFDHVDTAAYFIPRVL